jgi:Na+-transporting NADH:ubiquinone oxidoreductase subunit NqrD
LLSSAASCALSILIREQTPSLIRQGKWLFISLSNFVILVDQLQNSRDVCLFPATVIARDAEYAVT